jgi:hypothetical protein
MEKERLALGPEVWGPVAVALVPVPMEVVLVLAPGLGPAALQVPERVPVALAPVRSQRYGRAEGSVIAGQGR